MLAAHLGERLNSGDRERRDGFFDSDGPADSLLEGTLVTAARAWEDKKVVPIGKLYANLAFAASVSAADASFLLTLADRLTYRQLLLLAIVAQANERGELENAVVRLEAGIGGAWEPRVYSELDDLSSSALVGIRQNDGSAVPPSQTWGGGGWKPNLLVKAALMPMGITLCDLMELPRQPSEDIDAVCCELGLTL